MPGFACNLSCSYCYQRTSPDTQRSKPVLGRGSATDEILSEFIWQRAAERSCQSVSLTLLGGEPLVYMRQLVSFLKSVKEGGEITEIYLVTNGTLLDEEIVKSLGRFAPVSAQITFDGEQSRHDSYRFFRSLRGSYDRILSNIGSVRGMLDSLQIRINLTPSSIENARRVIDDLGRFTELKELDVSLAPIDDTQYFSSGEEWDSSAFQRYYELARYVVSNGAHLSPPGHSGTCLTCGDSENPGGIVLTGNGDLYSCWDSAGQAGFKVGDVVDGYDQKPGQAWVRCGYSDPKNGLVHRRLILECMRAIECHNE
ncbi:radical SAM protein [Arcanobacterium canis]